MWCDSNMVAWSLPPGTRLFNGKLSILEEHVGIDELVPADKRTSAILREIANQVSPMIVMEDDVASNHPSGRLPILDLEVWVSDNRIYTVSIIN